MSWNDLALNPRVILGYYSIPADLESVEVHSIVLGRDGPTLEMVVKLPTFPDRPSPRWDRGANAVQARFRFFGEFRDLVIEGWGTSNVGRLAITPVAGGVRFEFRGGSATCIGAQAERPQASSMPAVCTALCE